MITLAVCDNELIFRKNVMAICRSYFEASGILYEISEYASGEEFLVEKYPDILILNVKLKRLSGILVKDILTKMKAETRIIFVSKDKNAITEAFGRNVYGYLIKPLKYDAFCKKLDEIVKDIQEKENYVFCKHDDKFEKIYYKNILYIETATRSTKVYTQNGNGFRRSELTLTQWEKILENHGFVRCSRKYIINIHYVVDINHEIKLPGQITIPLGVPYKDVVMEKYYADRSDRAILYGYTQRTAGRADEIHR